MRITIAKTYDHARAAGATGAPGYATMPDGSRAVSVRALRGGAVHGVPLTGYVLLPGVELTPDDVAVLEVACLHSRTAALGAVDVFAKLVREVDAGRALLAMTTTPEDKRRAAADALALARDVLEDARQLLEPALIYAGGEPLTPDDVATIKRARLTRDALAANPVVLSGPSMGRRHAHIEHAAQLEAEDAAGQQRAQSAFARGLSRVFGEQP